MGKHHLDGVLLRFGSHSMKKHERNNFREESIKILDFLIPSVLAKISIDKNSELEVEKFENFSFTQADLHVSTKVKQFDTMDFALANMFYSKAGKLAEKLRLLPAHRLYVLSAKHFSNVIAVAPLRQHAEWYEARSFILGCEMIKDYPNAAARIYKVCQTIKVESVAKKKEFMEHYAKIVGARKNWKCTLKEIKEIHKLLESEEKQYSPTFKYAKSLNTSVEFELSSGYTFDFEILNETDLEFIMNLQNNNDELLRIKDGELSVQGLVVLGGMIQDKTKIQSVQIGDGPKINMVSFKGGNAKFNE